MIKKTNAEDGRQASQHIRRAFQKPEKPGLMQNAISTTRVR